MRPRLLANLAASTVDLDNDAPMSPSRRTCSPVLIGAEEVVKKRKRGESFRNKFKKRGNVITVFAAKEKRHRRSRAHCRVGASFDTVDDFLAFASHGRTVDALRVNESNLSAPP